MSIDAQMTEQRDASMTLLGTALVYERDDVLQSIPLDRWDHQVAKYVAEALALVAARKPWGPVEVTPILHAKAKGYEWGEFVAECFAKHVSTPEAIEHHTTRLMLSSAAIKATMVLGRSSALAASGDLEGCAAEARKAADAAEDTVADQDSELESIDVVAAALQADLDNGRGASVPVLTGFRWSDRMMGGVAFARGRFVIIGARPGMGKTALLLNLATGAAKHGPVLLWNGEMRSSELMGRMCANASGVDGLRISDGTLDQRESERVRRANGELASLPLIMSTKPGLTLDRLDAAVRKLRRRGHPPVMVVVDYIQLMRAPRGESRETAMAALSRGLKELAVAHDLCLVAASQLNRECEKRADKRPQTSDLRETGSLEQDADSIIFPFRQGQYDMNAPESEAKLYVEKNRGGPSPLVFDMHWTGSLQRWSDR